MKQDHPLNLAYLRECFELDSDSPSGLRWRSRPSSHFKSVKGMISANAQVAGKPAGFRNGLRWVVILKGGRAVQVSRVVYFLATNEDPLGKLVDHIDGDATNNNPTNLRLATSSQNNFNSKTRTNKRHPLKGVCQVKDKWMARIANAGRLHYLGLFPTPELAHAAYVAAARRMHGQFHRPA